MRLFLAWSWIDAKKRRTQSDKGMEQEDRMSKFVVVEKYATTVIEADDLAEAYYQVAWKYDNVLSITKMPEEVEE